MSDEKSEPRAWETAAVEVQIDTLKAALVETGGIIKHAAVAVGVTRQHATKLLRKYDLVEFAAKLRVESGLMNRTSSGAVLGRPRNG